MDNLALKEPPRIERIDGTTIMMSPRPLIQHSVVSSNIYRIFASYLHGKPCKAFADGVDVHLDDQNWFIPDVSIVCDRSIIHRDGIHGAPDLVVEVLSPSTARNDRGPKMQHYAAAGVKEYWIVSPLAKSVEVYLNHDGNFKLDDIYTDYPEWELSRMTDEERQAIRMDIPVSLYDDLLVNVKDVFEDVDAFNH